MIPLVSIIGRSNSGKTAVIGKVIKELKHRGYRVGTIKHSVHGFDIDVSGKDSWKHAQAGADTVMIASSNRIALIERTAKEKPINELAAYFKSVDIVIAEGFKKGDTPKIEVFRSKLYDEPVLKKGSNVLAYVVDNPAGFKSDKPVIEWNDTKRLVDLIEEKFLQKK